MVSPLDREWWSTFYIPTNVMVPRHFETIETVKQTNQPTGSFRNESERAHADPGQNNIGQGGGQKRAKSILV